MNEKAVRSIDTYVDNVEKATKEQKFDKDRITVEHRSNNTKRDFLFVNKVQGKHIPTKPSQTIEMCKELASVVGKGIRKGAMVLVVGFAETATAIAELVASNLMTPTDIVLTTREPRMDERARKLLTFEEEHSHATTQNIYFNKNKTLEEQAEELKKYDYVLFVDDEVSTGNTIINFIKAFKSLNINNNLAFGVASVCNWQSPKDQERFKKHHIDRFFLLGGELKSKEMKMEVPSKNILGLLGLRYSKPIHTNIHKVKTDTRLEDYRLLHSVDKFNGIEDTVVKKLHDDNIINSKNKKIRVIGTEEFMIIPLKVALKLEEDGYDVKFHSTTRSKIDIISPVAIDDVESYTSTDKARLPDDVINSGLRLPSIYDRERNTYIYDIRETIDTIIFITETHVSIDISKYYTNLFSELGLCYDVHFVVVGQEI